MRILVVAFGFPSKAHSYSGVFVLRQVQALRELGHEVRVLRIVSFVPPIRPWRVVGSLPHRYAYEGVDVHVARVLAPPRMGALPLVRAQAGLALRRHLAEFRPDVIHAHTLIRPGYVSVKRSVPTIVTSHGYDAYRLPLRCPGLRAAARWVVREADVVVGVSGFIRDHLVALGRRDARVVLNGADPAVFGVRDRCADRGALGIESERFVVAFVGGLLQAKGVHDLIPALGGIRELRPLALFGGFGPEESVMRRTLADAGVEARFLGMVPHEQVARIFGAADVVALPSHAEGLPTVLCEAMLAGRAVVATSVGGIPEIVRDGVTGRLVPAGDVAALSASLRLLAAQPETRRAYEREAATFAQRCLTWRTNASAYEELYREAIEGTKPSVDAGDGTDR